MSELMNTTCRSAHWQLLATVSSLALITSIGVEASYASDGMQDPTVWIELGGQLERVDGGQDAFLPPFTRLSPTPDPYSPISPAEAQKPAINGYGIEGEISFSPKGTDWIFSAAVRYGRSNNKKRLHQQSAVQTIEHFPGGPIITATQLTITAQQFADYQTRNEESHTVLDFAAGRDVGLGLLSRYSKSQFSAGIRIAEFSTRSQARIIARPGVDFHDVTFGKYHFAVPSHNDYIASAQTDRGFRGVGPSISWDASIPVLGNPDAGSINFDWGINAAVLFGRQKASGSHSTDARHYDEKYYQTVPPYGAIPLYHHSGSHNRSRSVVVPNIGGFAGVSFRYPNAKVSFGYRADFFLGAMDTGIDVRHTVDRNFYGPFATISIGLGG